MKQKKMRTALLIITATAALIMTGCAGGNKETEAETKVSETASEQTVQTESDAETETPETESSQPETEAAMPATLNEIWLQEESNDPLQFVFTENGEVSYEATVSRESEYMTQYAVEGDVLTIQLVKIDVSGVLPVEYKITYDDADASRVHLELMENSGVDMTGLYGMETTVPGWYTRTLLNGN